MAGAARRAAGQGLLDSATIPGESMTQREKLLARVDALPANCMCTITVIVGRNGEPLVWWLDKLEARLEGLGPVDIPAQAA